jgi:hypothetical protein
VGCIESCPPPLRLACATQSGRLPVLLHGQGCRAFSQRPGRLQQGAVTLF